MGWGGDAVASLVALLALDVASRMWLRPLRKPAHTRWCAVHAAANVLIAAAALPSLLAVHAAPLATTDSAFPTVLAVALHLYHVVAYELSADDRGHHLLFVALMGTPSLLHHHRGTNAMLVFLSGAPGALIYGLIAAQRCGRMLWADERTVSALVNVGLRTPGVFYVVARFAPAALAAPTLPAWVTGLQIGLPVLNVGYYSWQSVSRWRRANPVDSERDREAGTCKGVLRQQGTGLAPDGGSSRRHAA